MSRAAIAAVRSATPRPPADPALRGLGAALDGGAMKELIGRHLPDCARGELEVERCDPRYIRYKPGTNSLVQYDISLVGHDPQPIATLAHVWLYSDRHAEVLWATRSFQRLVDRAHGLPDPPSARATLLPEAKGLLEVYPVDRKMPGLLGASMPAVVQDALRVLGSPTGDVPVVDRAEPVRYKPGRKAVLRYDLAGDGRALYGRVHADGRGAALLEAGRGLVAAGVPTPTPLGFVRDLGLLFVEEAAGTRMADLPDDDYERWLPAVAQALAALHSAQVDPLPPLAKRNKEGAVLGAARTIATIRPGVGRLALRLGATIAARLAESPGASAPVHGDFYDDQVLVSAAGVTFLDFDAAGRGNPLLDVGNMLAHLRARRGERSHRIFLEAYGAARPEVAELMPLFEAAALLRIGITPFRWLRPDWPQEVERRVALAAERLDDDVPSRRFSFAPIDARLPQLELLQDPGHMGRELERLLPEGPVEVVRATVVRHKPGRRCLFRYDVRVGTGGRVREETIYGKAFASGRGAEVERRLRTVASAAAWGPTVSIPDSLGYVASLKLLLQRGVPGEPAPPYLLAGDLALTRRIAEAVHTLHGSVVDLDRRHGLDDEIAPLKGRVERLAATDGRLSDVARRCLKLVERAAERAWSWRWRPVHRDFYHDQVLVTEDGLSILDWDDAAMSEPAVDVANFLAHLRLLALQRSEPHALDEISAVFETRYRQLDDGLDPDLVRFLKGTTLLRLAEIHRPWDRGEWVASNLLEQSERLLAS